VLASRAMVPTMILNRTDRTDRTRGGITAIVKVTHAVPRVEHPLRVRVNLKVSVVHGHGVSMFLQGRLEFHNQTCLVSMTRPDTGCSLQRVRREGMCYLHLCVRMPCSVPRPHPGNSTLLPDRGYPMDQRRLLVRVQVRAMASSISRILHLVLAPVSRVEVGIA